MSLRDCPRDLFLAILPRWHDVDDIAGLRQLYANLMAGQQGVAAHTHALLRTRFPAGLDE